MGFITSIIVGLVVMVVVWWFGSGWLSRRPRKVTLPADRADFKVAILGAGFSGLGLAIELKKRGIPFVVFEKAPSVGGTWWFNRYPGCACDIPSHLYSFSFEPNPHWSRVFPPQNEILTYLQHCASKYHITEHIRFGKRVVGARFDNDSGRWHVTMTDVASGADESFVADVCVSGMGGLHVPSYPDIPGRESFAGRSVHTSEWPAEAPFDIKGRTFGVIGSAASAIQTIPALVRGGASKVFVFQRTPNWISPRPDGPYAKWVRDTFASVPFIMWLARCYYYLRQELILSLVFAWRSRTAVAFRRFLESTIRRRVGDKKCRDGSSMADALTPNYPPGCKRILISNAYYRALAHDATTLVTEPIVSIAPNGVVVRARTDTGAVEEHLIEFETLVYATGFQVIHGYPGLIGRTGRDLATDVWKTLPRAFLGCSVPEYPNFFMLLGPNSALGHNSVVWMIECQIAHVVHCITTMLERNLKSLEVKQRVFDDFQTMLQSNLKDSVWARPNCVSWYQNPDGVVFTVWPGHTWSFWWETFRSTVDRDYDVVSR